MPSLKDLRARINSVKNTRKITSAMKMVAAAKLRRAQEQAEAARPYAERLERMLGELAGSLAGQAGAPRMLAGTGRDDTHLLVVCTADRGLCGGFNATIVREARRTIARLQGEGKTVKVLCVGKKGRDSLRRDYSSLIVDAMEGIGRPKLTYDDALRISNRVLSMFDKDEFDVCSIVYNRFKSAISQIVTVQQLVPFAPPETNDADAEATPSGGSKAVYEFEPSEGAILEALLPRNMGTQIFRALLENNASEQGARMTAMDNATRNAGDLINRLTLTYNRQRQANITKELIEIISGAEAL